MKVLLAYNPNAGSFDQRLLDQLNSALTAKGHSVVESDSHAPGLAENAKKCQHICVIGGDGTLRDVIATAHNSNPSVIFSQFPLGTINLVAREAGYGKNITDLVSKIDGGIARHQYHLAHLDQDIFLACASVGPDALSVNRVSIALKKRIGRFAYAAAFLGQFIAWKRQNLSVEIDGRTYRSEAAYILKGRYFAGPWILSATAALPNPKLSILLLPTARRFDFLRLMASVAVHSKFAVRDWVRLECEEISISAETKTPIQADGDIVGHLPVRMRAGQNAVNFA